MNKSDYDKYYKKGGDYVLPIEIFNELFDEIERLKEELKSLNFDDSLYIAQKDDEIKELNDSITWWNNRFNAVERNNRELRDRIDKAIEYHDNCVNNLLDLDKIDDNEKLAYKVAYEIHDNYLNILKGSDKE